MKQKSTQPSPQQGPPPRRPSMLSEILDRVVRIETRVVKLLAHHNLDASGDPKKPTN
jgi:hypothetical protein